MKKKSNKKELLRALKLYNYSGFDILGEIDIETIKAILGSGDLNSLVIFYNTMLVRDLHISSEIQKRKMQLLSIPTQIKSESEVAKSFIEEVFKSFDIDDLILDISSAIPYGFSAIDLVWGYENIGNNRAFIPLKSKFIKHQHFYKDYEENRIYLRQKDNSKTFIEHLPKFILHKHKTTSGEIEDYGLLRLIGWFFTLKHFILSNYLQYTELLGVPPLLIKTARSEDTEIAEIIEQVLMLRSSSVGAIGKDDEAILLEAKNNHDFLRLPEYIDRKISNMILGNTLAGASGESGGSYSLGQVHNGIRIDYLKFDCRLISKTINSLIDQILKFNMPNAKVTFSFDVAEKDNKLEKSQIYKNLLDMGYRVKREFVESELNVELEEEREKEDNSNTREIEEEVFKKF